MTKLAHTPLALFAVLATRLLAVSGQTWCGKHYMAGSSVVDPGGQFPVVGTSDTPLLTFHCNPAIKPYLAEDAHSPASILIDAGVTYTKVDGAQPITFGKALGQEDTLAVTVSINGKAAAHGTVPSNTTAHPLSFSLSGLGLTPQKAPFDVSCEATLGKQTFHASSQLFYLPNPTNGSAVKLDYATGAVLAKPADGSDGPYAPVFPIGFYTSFGGYLETNSSAVDFIAEKGFTIIHPIPTFDNLTVLGEVLDRMEEKGLYLMYDMRGTYMNDTSVTEQVNMIKSRPNLLTWYTGDEPDGTSDPLNATTIAYNLINDLDGYHPVSLVLNCENYYWTDYQDGTDILMQDTYMIDINATYSTVWNTSCTPDFGDCGCDNCKGEFEDISTRMDEFNFRLDVVGQRRIKSVWTVPQAFGVETYWPRYPTGPEWVVQSLLGVNHGALGIVPWADPTPTDILDSASSLALALPSITPFLFSLDKEFKGFTTGRVDVGMWTVGSETLVLAANMNYFNASVSLAEVLPKATSAKQVFDSGSTVSASHGSVTLAFGSVGAGGFVISH